VQLDQLSERTPTRYVAAYGEAAGLNGTPPIRILAADVRFAGDPDQLTSAGDVVLRDLNRARLTGEPYQGGWEGNLIWLLRSSVGYELELGLVISPWILVITAPSADELQATLEALAIVLSSR
jgi:hypothetical protein